MKLQDSFLLSLVAMTACTNCLTEDQTTCCCNSPAAKLGQHLSYIYLGIDNVDDPVTA